MQPALLVFLTAWLGAGRVLGADAPEIPIEVQLCLQHLRVSERTRAEKALGPLQQLPLYQVQLTVDPERLEVRGQVLLRYHASQRELRQLPLRVTPNAFGAGRVTVTAVKVNGVAARVDHEEPSLYRVHLEPALSVGASADVELEVTAKVPRSADNGESMVSPSSPDHSDHGAFAATPNVISLIGVLPQVPAIDEKGAWIDGPTGMGDLGLYEPANYLATITVPVGYRVLATGVALGEVPDPTHHVKFSFGAAAVRDFPVLIARGYDVLTQKVDDVVIESHFRHEDAKVGREVLEDAVSSIAELEQRLGPLPYTRFKVVEAPLTGGAGGMEFPGLITVGTALYRGVQDPLKALGGENTEVLKALLEAQGMGAALELPNLQPMMRQTMEFTVAHEVAHQYFAGLVGSDPIREPAVDETLAQYTALLFIEWKHGKEVAREVRKQQLQAPYQMYRLTGGQDGVVDRPTSEFHSGIEYGALVYGKGPHLHREERMLVGDAAFFKGMRAYVDEYRFKWACGDCFTQVLARLNPTHAQELHALRKHWWKESHGDEDLGGMNIADLASQVGGQQLDPQVQEMLDQVLPQLGGH